MKIPNSPLIPIIIVNWNGISDTIECIESLSNQTFRNFVVYLVDNNSTDGSREVLQTKYKDVSWIKLSFNDQNLGFTKANNAIMNQILDGENVPPYLILLNNDTTQDPRWLENITNSAENNKAAVISSKMIDFFNRDLMDNAGHFMLTTGEIISIGHQQPIDRYNKPFENIGACGGAALYSTKMLKDIGVFDDFFDTGYEDAELGLRAFVAGYKCWYEPSAVIYHKMGQSIKKIFNYEYVLKIQKSIWYTYFKLVPANLILISIPSLIFKYVSLTIIHIVFWQPKYLDILNKSIWHGVINNRKTINVKRKRMLNFQNRVSGFTLRKMQVFFFWYDIQRFYKYYVLKSTMFFEKYSQEAPTDI